MTIRTTGSMVLDSIWLHVRACGHWTRRVYDLFRVKLQKEHGLSIGETSNIHLRTSMRSRMSRSYINELRGSNGKELEAPMNMNNHGNVASSSIQTCDVRRSKMSSMSLPEIIFHNKLSPSSHSATSLREQSKLNTPERSIVNEVTTSDRPKDEIPPTTYKPIIKNNRLTVPPSGDYCLRISNVSSICDDEQQPQQNPQTMLNDSRGSDVLGYLHMYQNNNRIQFNTIEFNDREDLQVKPMNFTFVFASICSRF